MQLDQFDGDALKMLSHALPVPSANGNIFPAVRNRIVAQVSPKPTTWINVFHAVPGRFNLADLPTSPPSTPGNPSDSEDYFTFKVFDTAVAVPDYAQSSWEFLPMPRSPRPVVPPNSVDLSIVERYIPPPSPTEAKGMFAPKSGSSLLLDRFSEMSPNGGLLFLVYPTKTGAKRFMNEYIGPILEPLLRSMAIINELSADLGSSLHKMAAVEHLVDFGELKASVEQFCRQRSADNDRFQPDKKSTYSVVYSARQEVMPDRATWSADWWIKQEKARVRTTVAKYFQRNPKLHHDKEIVPTAIVQEVLDGVEKNSRPDWRPSKGIEVGIFIIKKTWDREEA